MHLHHTSLCMHMSLVSCSASSLKGSATITPPGPFRAPRGHSMPVEINKINNYSLNSKKGYVTSKINVFQCFQESLKVSENLNSKMNIKSIFLCDWKKLLWYQLLYRFLLGKKIITQKNCLKFSRNSCFFTVFFSINHNLFSLNVSEYTRTMYVFTSLDNNVI